MEPQDRQKFPNDLQHTRPYRYCHRNLAKRALWRQIVPMGFNRISPENRVTIRRNLHFSKVFLGDFLHFSKILERFCTAGVQIPAKFAFFRCRFQQFLHFFSANLRNMCCFLAMRRCEGRKSRRLVYIRYILYLFF